jgi:hypothetical protein
MNLAGWLRVLDTVGGLAAASRRFRARGEERAEERTGMQPGARDTTLEARLAGVVVAALKEAFDRDRARLDLERSELDAQRARAEEALRLELLRQSADRGLGQLRAIAILGVALWITTAVLAAWLPGMREALPRVLLAGGWLALIGALASTFAAYQQLTGWVAATVASRTAPAGPAAGLALTAAPWLLVAGLALSASSLIAAL